MEERGGAWSLNGLILSCWVTSKRGREATWIFHTRGLGEMGWHWEESSFRAGTPESVTEETVGLDSVQFSHLPRWAQQNRHIVPQCPCVYEEGKAVEQTGTGHPQTEAQENGSTATMRADSRNVSNGAIDQSTQGTTQQDLRHVAKRWPPSFFPLAILRLHPKAECRHGDC